MNHKWITKKTKKGTRIAPPKLLFIFPSPFPSQFTLPSQTKNKQHSNPSLLLLIFLANFEHYNNPFSHSFCQSANWEAYHFPSFFSSPMAKQKLTSFSLLPSGFFFPTFCTFVLRLFVAQKVCEPHGSKWVVSSGNRVTVGSMLHACRGLEVLEKQTSSWGVWVCRVRQ